MLPPFSWSEAATNWQFAPIVTGFTAILAVLYLWGAFRVRKRHPRRPWPLGRTILFLLGLLVINLATQSGIGTYDDTLFWDHMIQHLMLLMIAPPLLVSGMPVTLLLHASRNPVHAWVIRIIRSKPVTWITWPAVGIVAYAAVIVGTHLTNFMNLVIQYDAVHEAEHVLYLVVGYLYFLPLVGKEPIKWKVSYPLRLFLLFLAMPVDAFTGVVLGLLPELPVPADGAAKLGADPDQRHPPGRRGDVDRRRGDHVRGDHGDVLLVEQGATVVGGDGLVRDRAPGDHGRSDERGRAHRGRDRRGWPRARPARADGPPTSTTTTINSPPTTPTSPASTAP